MAIRVRIRDNDDSTVSGIDDAMTDTHPYPLARLGLVGGGQLARMMIPPAKRLGCTCVVLDPTPDAPAGQMADRQIVGDFHDAARLAELAAATDVLTFDLEDIDTEALIELEQQGTRIVPSPELLRTIQDKLRQKQRLHDAGIPTAHFEAVDTPTREQFERFGHPLVQKARRGGYDGRGVVVMRDPSAFDEHLPVPSLIERFVPARKEIGVLVVRGRDGDTRVYPPVEMVFRPGENVLDMLLAPADVPETVVEEAARIAVRTVEALDGVGVFGVEMFWAENGSLLVNEVAPRTHNSGHHTIETCVTDQFEQHVRAVLGLPLGSTELERPAAMINLLGAPGATGRPVIEGLEAALAIPGVCVHLYGKAVTKPHRKMGHVTVVDEDLERARAHAERVRELVRITAEDPK